MNPNHNLDLYGVQIFFFKAFYIKHQAIWLQHFEIFAKFIEDRDVLSTSFLDNAAIKRAAISKN